MTQIKKDAAPDEIGVDPDFLATKIFLLHGNMWGPSPRWNICMISQIWYWHTDGIGWCEGVFVFVFVLDFVFQYNDEM